MKTLFRSVAFLLLLTGLSPLRAADGVAPDTTARTVTFDGKMGTVQWALKDLNAQWPTDWSDYNFLVLEMRSSTPQRFSLWMYTTEGTRRIEIQPFGQNIWMRAAVPLQFFKGRASGNDLAAATNRKYGSFWISVWGPFGETKNVQGLGVTMFYPINQPKLEIRSMKLAKEDPGSVFFSETGEVLPNTQVVDQFGQWAFGDWPRKLHSQEQLAKELADEEKTLTPTGFNFDKFGGILGTQGKVTGFFHVEEIDGKWWMVDPEGHFFICQSLNGLGGGGGRRGGPPADAPAVPTLQSRRLQAWGFNTGPAGVGMPYIARFNIAAGAGGQRGRGPEQPGGAPWLGLPDVYADDFAARVDQAASAQCTPRKDDPLLVGYFIGNEPPFSERESEVCDMILAGAATGTQAKLKEFLAAGDTKARREEFVITAFEKYLTLVGDAIKKYDPNHLNLGIRFGGEPTDAIMRTGRLFDVCSINVYEYEPTKQVKRAHNLTGRPILIGEFHIGVPANGFGSGLVQARDQVERGKAYRYFVEQAVALPSCVGAHWFTWQDEPVLGRFDGENYNIGFVDFNNRAYPELVEAAKATHRQLGAVHEGKTPAFAERPLASSAGTPETPWGEEKYRPVFNPAATATK